MPKLNVIGTGSDANSLATAERMRSAARNASCSELPGSSRVNSSPPVRAMVSAARPCEARMRATRTRARSPARWPSWSLTNLK